MYLSGCLERYTVHKSSLCLDTKIISKKGFVLYYLREKISYSLKLDVVLIPESTKKTTSVIYFSIFVNCVSGWCVAQLCHGVNSGMIDLYTIDSFIPQNKLIY